MSIIIIITITTITITMNLSSETDSLPSSDRSCADGSAMNE